MDRRKVKMSILQELEAEEAQYDEHVKRILSNRYILAWILKYTTAEFGEMTIQQIAEECISEEILVSKVRVMPGETNKKQPERIVGANVEDKVPGEGKICYDIRFSAYTLKKEEAIKILMNVEAQKSFYRKYPLVTRGVFYAARMISAQMDTEFTASDYSGMKKVYSIWICMNTPDYIGNAISEYSIKKRDIIDGMPDNKEDYDKISIIMLCLNGTKKGREKGEGLVGLLNTLLAMDMKAEEKGKILKENYDIEVNAELGEEMEHMCNLGEGLVEEAYEEGIEEGIRVLIETCQELGHAKEETISKIKEKSRLSSDAIEELMEKYWK